MVFEWLAREGWIVLSWWLLVTLAGVAAFPLCARLLSGLPDRGYTLARATGLLLVGWVFWLLGSLGFLPNTTGSILLAWLIVLVGTVASYFNSHERVDWRAWWRENRSVVLVSEILFAFLLLGWTIVRAHQNGLSATEKPMDLMFISSIMRSPSFPPLDAWMSGYSISYYYFGYLIAAMLSMMSGIPSTIGFNLFISLLFALTGLTAFGVAYNLVRSRAKYDPQTDDLIPRLPSTRPALLTGLLAMILVVLMGNFQVPLIEIPFQSRTASEAYLQFTGTQEREVYPERQQARDAGIPDDQPVTLNAGRPDPSNWGAWWWFRASRVLNDFNLDGTVFGGAQPIDEFPQFSFLLADNHPHVMALPFVMLSLGLALNLLLTQRNPNRSEIIFYGLCIGALVFFNTWDVLTGLMIMLGADGIRRLMRGQGRLSGGDWIGMFLFAVSLGVLTVAFYFPFLISFRSQASGILPNVISPTLLQQYFIMFGPFILILIFFLAIEAWRAGSRMNWTLGFQLAGLLFISVFFVLLALMLAALLIPEVNAAVLQFTTPYGGLGGALPAVLSRRLVTLPTTLVLLAAVVVIIGRLFPRRPSFSKAVVDASDSEDQPIAREERVVITYPYSTAFALVLVAIGVLLSLVPEFFYLRDNFGSRINTIFKFYYQAWLVFSIASAYGVYTVLADSRLKQGGSAFRAAFAFITVIAVGAGLLYPIFGIRERALIETGRLNNLQPAPLTLNGGETLLNNPNDYAAIMCLRDQIGDEPVVIAEISGGAYNIPYPSGRVASLTGNPVILGWQNHERQWRGSTYDAAAGTRSQDLQQLYTDLRWDVVAPFVQRYGIDYIFYGSSERIEYGSAGEEKFREMLEPVCEQGGSVFYRVTDSALQVALE